MSKIYTITLHHIINPGSVLQTYALYEYLILNGYETEVIDYRPSIYYQSIKDCVITNLLKILEFKSQLSQRRKYRLFINKNISLTSRMTIESIGNLDNEDSIFIAGSDQIWNLKYPCGNDLNYFLGFVKNGKKLSYAASLGDSACDEDDICIIANRVKDFYWTSIREREALDELKNNGISDLSCVCDPVFLLQKEKYKKLMIPIKQSNYVYVYLVQPSVALDCLIKYYKSEGKLIIQVGNRKKCDCDILLKDLSPDEFISYIFYADVVVSSSFHATAFSLIFEREFYTILPKKNQNRISDILGVVSLEKRAIDCGVDNLKDILAPYIEYESVTPTLNEYINFSKNILNTKLIEIEMERNTL